MKAKWLKRIIPRALTVGMIVVIMVMAILPLPTYAANNSWIQFGGTGTGNWSDVNHWSLGHVPDATESAIFDAASFNGAGQIVTIDANANCLNMDWTGATNNPTLAGAAPNILQVYGDVTFITNMSVTYSYYMRLCAAAIGKTFTTNGCSLTTVNISPFTAAGGWTLQDDLICKSFLLSMGSFDTNGKTITCTGGAFELSNSSGGTRTLTLGSSTINCSVNGLIFVMTNSTVPANTSTIKLASNLTTFAGGDCTTFHNIELNGANHTITGSNTFTKLSFKPAGAQAITFTDTTTQTTASFERTGTGQITFQGSGVGGWALADSNGGTNTFNALTVSRCTAIGANFIATTSSLNSGNNVGWTFPLTATTQDVSLVTMDKDGTTGGTFNGTVVDMGGVASVDAYFVYGLTHAYGSGTTPVAKTAPATYTASVPIGLTPGATYYCEAVVVEGINFGNGAEKTIIFTMPTVTTGNTSQSGASLTFNGNVTDMGKATSTYGYFEWGYNTSYGNATSLQAISGTGNYSASIPFYMKGQTIYYRTVVQNGSVKSYGLQSSVYPVSAIETSFPILNIIPFVFVGMMIILIIGLGISGGISIPLAITLIAVLIYVGLALLPGMQWMINSL